MAEQTASTITECQNEVGPEKSADEIVKANSAGLAAVLKAAGVKSCTTSQQLLITPFIGAGSSISSGCEQIAAISSAMDVSQKVFECTFNRIAQSQSTNVVQNLTVDISIGTGVQMKNCGIYVSQYSNLRVAKYSSFSSEVKQALTANLNAAMEGFLDNLQTEETKGLFPTSNGQKAFEGFTKVIRQKIDQRAFNDTVQNVMESYESSGTVTIRLDPYVSIGFEQSGPGVNCIAVDQRFITQVASQNIMASALDIVFSATEAADMKEVLQNGQYRKNSGLALDFGFGSAFLVVIIVIIIIMVVRRKGADGGSSSPLITGQLGVVLGVILLILGIGAIIAGIVILLLGKTVLGILTMVFGVAIAVMGLVMFLRARAAQALLAKSLLLGSSNASSSSTASSFQREIASRNFSNDGFQKPNAPSSTGNNPVDPKDDLGMMTRERFERMSDAFQKSRNQ